MRTNEPKRARPRAPKEPPRPPPHHGTLRGWFATAVQRLRTTLRDEYGVWAHWQNLRAGTRGPASLRPWHGRAWLHVGAAAARMEWVFGRVRLGVGVTRGGGDDDWRARLELPGLSLYGGLEHPRLGGEHRAVSLEVHHGALWWNLGMDPHRGDHTDPRWRRGSWFVLDTVLGVRSHRRRVVSVTETAIPMPEGPYPATVTLVEDTWFRPRATWSVRKEHRAQIDIANAGIPMPGRGENAWDCAQDATLSFTTDARTVAQAVHATRKSVLQTRAERGGPRWCPSPARTSS